MDRKEIKQILIEELNLDELIINGSDGHFQIVAVGEIFNGISKVKQQQIIYAPLMKYIANNRIHAISIKVYTPEEWVRDHKEYKLNNYSKK